MRKTPMSRRSALLGMLCLPFAAVMCSPQRAPAAAAVVARPAADDLVAKFEAWSAGREFVVTDSLRG